MAKMLITGVRKVDFTDEKGRPVKGTSLYYKQKLESREGLMAAGYTTEKVWIKDGTELELKMLRASYEKPFEAEFIFDIIPGGRRPVLADIVF